MRLAVFGSDRGPRLGVVEGADVVDVTGQVFVDRAHPAGPLQALLEQPVDLGTLAGRPRHLLSDVTLLPPLPRPGKIVAAPVNYRDHQQEMAAPLSVEQLGVFLKASSSVVGPGAAVELPYSDVRTDQEAELAVVIGRTTRRVAADRALEHVAGYTCLFDITVRSTEDRSTRKSFDTFTLIGPWLVTPDEVGDPGRLGLRCWVNGELRQDADTADLIYGVPELVAYASSVLTLYPGDIIATGTPAGVGPLHDGDRLAMEIDRIGRLELSVTGRHAVPYADRPGARALAEETR